jgi:hypothetical protein
MLFDSDAVWHLHPWLNTAKHLIGIASLDAKPRFDCAVLKLVFPKETVVDRKDSKPCRDGL